MSAQDGDSESVNDTSNTEQQNELSEGEDSDDDEMSDSSSSSSSGSSSSGTLHTPAHKMCTLQSRIKAQCVLIVFGSKSQPGHAY